MGISVLQYQAMLKKQRVVARDYRNRKIGGFLKELKLTEGRGTGLPIIHSCMEENGSPPPVFETDENNAYFLCILQIHPLTTSILGQEDDQRKTKDKSHVISNISELHKHLRSQKTLQRDQVEPKLLSLFESVYLKVLTYCEQPQSRIAIFNNLAMYNNSRNFNNYIKPLIDEGWLNLTNANKPTSKNQMYYTTDNAKLIIDVFLTENNNGIKRLPITSSNIASVGYDKETQILEIEFHHGAIYQYFDVPEMIHEELMSSPSQSAYFMNEIKNNFKHKKK